MARLHQIRATDPNLELRVVGPLRRVKHGVPAASQGGSQLRDSVLAVGPGSDVEVPYIGSQSAEERDPISSDGRILSVRLQ